MTPSKPVPVSILTGFLGAGKTTLLNYILKQQHEYKFAVIINEVGKIGVDGQLVETQKEEVVEMSNGCLCCTVQDEFLPTMQTLLQRAEQLDGIVVETSGLALPLPLVQAFNGVLQRLERSFQEQER
ncbi:MAG: hypothetical protein EBS01_11890, partial [Verrucomicrobia bacterium]|nr:hypothetical protein [Verrucomicrobiota bacterium]